MSHMFILQIPTNALNCSNREEECLSLKHFFSIAIQKMIMVGGVRREQENIYLFPFVPMIPVNGSQEHGVSYINSVKFLNLRVYPEC